MKKLLITFGALIILTSCGYSSENECRLKEMQKCDSGACETQVRYYCSDEFSGDSWVDTFESIVYFLLDLMVVLAPYLAPVFLIGSILAIFKYFSSDVEERAEHRDVALGCFFIAGLIAFFYWSELIIIFGLN